MMVMVMTIKITIVFSWSGEDDENSDEVLMTLTKFLPRYILVTRSVCTLILTILPIATSLALYIDDRFDIFDKTLCQRKPSIRPSLTRHGEAGLLSGAVQSLSWALHLMYTFLLHHRWHQHYISTLMLYNMTTFFRLSLSVRGPRLAIIAWLAALLANLVQVKFLWVRMKTR